MSELELIKNYIDAKIAYELSAAGVDARRGGFVVSTSYTPDVRAIIDRWVNAETEINLAISDGRYDKRDNSTWV